MNQTQLRFLWRENLLARRFRAGVSLHSHTMHSLESLTFIPRYAEAVPALAWEIRRQARKYREKYKRELDYTAPSGRLLCRLRTPLNWKSEA